MSYELIKDFPNYRINTEGNVQSCYKFKTNIPCDTWRDVQHVYDKSCGYMLVTLAHNGIRKNKRVHRLLMETFVPNPDNKPQINHKDTNKLNNLLSNLEWATSKENSSHAATLGLYEPAIEATRTPVIMYDKDLLVELQEFKSLHDAGRDTGIQWTNIWKVCNGQRHTAGGYHWKYKNV